MLEIDIVIVATRRLTLLEQMIESFSEKVFGNFKIAKVFVNIDPIWGDNDDQTAIKKLLNQTFPDVTIFEPQEANFTKAVQRLWKSTSADVVLHLEEDWIALEQINSIDISENLTGDVRSLSLMHSEKNWNGKQIYHYRRPKLFNLLLKFEDKSRPLYSTSPSFWSGDFLRQCALRMDINYDPEKQFYDDLNMALQNFVADKKCKFLIGHPNKVQDIGRSWRDERHIDKIITDGVSRWISKTFIPPDSTRHLVCTKHAAAADTDGLLCLSLTHNEIHILPQFLEHYRSIGVKHFVIVDDHSSDGTKKLLSKQHDVTVYEPGKGSTYQNDKIDWRCDLLDVIADQKWVLLPDIDEHFVYPMMEKHSIDCLINHMKSEGASGLFTVMIDMYCDKPLKDHHFDEGNLVEAFPLFDTPSDPLVGYRLLPPAKRFLKRFPTPPVCAYGGVRDRIFLPGDHLNSIVSYWLLKRFAHFDRPLNPSFFQKRANSMARFFSKNTFGSYPLSMTKIGLIKWEKGIKFPGGPHAVSKNLKLSSTTGAFLHFKFTKGIEGIEYIAERGQHAGGSIVYKKILDQINLFELSPLDNVSKRFTGSQSLIDCGIIRTGSYPNKISNM